MNGCIAKMNNNDNREWIPPFMDCCWPIHGWIHVPIPWTRLFIIVHQSINPTGVRWTDQIERTTHYTHGHVIMVVVDGGRSIIMAPNDSLGSTTCTAHGSMAQNRQAGRPWTFAIPIIYNWIGFNTKRRNSRTRPMIPFILGDTRNGTGRGTWFNSEWWSLIIYSHLVGTVNDKY